MENVPGEQPGSSPTSTAHSPDWHKRFNWKKGALLETLFEGDWWESVIVDLDSDRALLHYVGGDEEEDEWIPLSSSRLRPPQAEAEPAEPSGLRADVVEPPARPSEHARRGGREKEDDSSAQRPMRRSRMLSDDARLALQLQEEELKAARGMHSAGRKRSKPSPRKDSSPKQRKVDPPKPAPAPPAPSRSQPAPPPPANRKIASPRSDPAHSSASRSQPSARAPPAKTVASAPSKLARTAPAPGSRKQPAGKETAAGGAKGGGGDERGMVSFQLVPDETVGKSVPRLKRSRIQLGEDETVMAIKQRVHEEVFPTVPASQIEIRTPSNILCGQDHALKYVRTFLWPPSKGDLTLLYSKAKEGFL